MNPLPECCFPHSAPIPHQFVMKVYVDAWIYVTEKFVNMGNIELYGRTGLPANYFRVP